MPNYRLISRDGDIVTLQELKEEKTMCWCEYSPEDRFPSVFVTRASGRPIRIEIDFCPQCGRFLKG